MKKTTFLRDPAHLAEGMLNADYVYVPDGDQDAGYTLAYHREVFYEWIDGVWVVIADDEVKCRITDHLRKLKTVADSDADDIHITVSNVNNVFMCLKSLVRIPASRLFSTWPYDTQSLGIHCLAMHNGVLMFYPFKRDPRPAIKTANPALFNIVRLPYNFDPEAACPLWEAFLDTSMCGDSEYIMLLQQWCGYLLSPDMRHHKFLLNVGEGANGKSVFVDVMQGIVGPGNYSSVSLHRFGSPFSLHETLGKLVNCTDETASIMEEEAESELKKYVTGMQMTFERKFRSPVVAAPTAKVVVNTNSLPRFRDRSNGTWRRILLVPWDHVVPADQQIKDLAREICSRELPGIFNWALRGLASLNHNNGFVQPGRTEDLLEEYRRDSDPVRAFLLENYTFAPNGLGTPCSDLYTEYRRYCDESGCKPVNNRTFGQQVKRVFPQVARSRPGGGNTRAWIYRGLIPSVSHASQGHSY